MIYREYLKNYLYVMCNAKQYSRIFVWEPFAGGGLDESNEAGSALIAAAIIDGFRKNYRETDIRLFLNELDNTRYQSLKRATSKHRSFVRVYNWEAEEFLSQVHSELKKISHNRNLHNLFFIDPYGYTQYSRKNLDQLFGLKNSDYLLFIPTYHIYRFSKKEISQAYRFVSDLGINSKQCNGLDSLAEKLKDKLKQKAQTKFGYQYRLENKEASHSIFHLFFVTKHIKGAEKFLEAKNKVKEKIERSNNQLSFLDPMKSEIESKLRKILFKEITNYKLFEEIIKMGYLSKEVKPILKKWEDEGELRIRAEFKRKKGSYYLTDSEKTVFIKVKK